MDNKYIRNILCYCMADISSWVENFVQRVFSEPEVRDFPEETKQRYLAELRKVGERVNVTIMDDYSPQKNFLELRALSLKSDSPLLHALLRNCLAIGGVGVGEEVTDFANELHIPKRVYFPSAA